MMLQRRSMIDQSKNGGKSWSSCPLLELNLRKILLLMAMLAVLGSVIEGCSPFYVIRAAYEEGKILWRREPIPEYLEKPDLTAETQDKLKLVLDVREYARDVLKLNVGGSYSSYSYVDRPDLTYILTAAPRTELRPYTWWFLIVGRVPYKGYFSKEEAAAAAKALEDDGYDTNIRTSAAFSTLGWFDDPLLAHLLRYDKVTLAEVVFHELFHNTLYIKGAGAFNESAANFVGGRAAIDFFRDRFGAGSPEHDQAIRAWEQLLLRQQLFTEGKEEWSEWVTRHPTHRFRNFSKQPLNNAVIIRYMLYLKNLKLFEALYDAEGKSLMRTIASIREAVAKDGEPFKAVQNLLDKRNQAVVKSAVAE